MQVNIIQKWKNQYVNDGILLKLSEYKIKEGTVMPIVKIRGRKGIGAQFTTSRES